MIDAIQSIAQAVGHIFGGMSAEEVLSKRRRSATTVLARHVTLFVARAELGLSYSEAARCVGCDHTSVMHGVKRVAALIEKGEKLVLEAVKAGEDAAIAWRECEPGERMTPTEKLRNRRKQITRQIIELASEAREIDGLLGVRPCGWIHEGREAVAAE
jgi:hypothetical protein